MKTCRVVEVVFASESTYQIFSVEAPCGSRIKDVIEKSGILGQFPEIQRGINQVGIFGVLKQWDERVEAGDRIEIYRPLKRKAMEMRRLRVKKEKIK